MLDIVIRWIPRHYWVRLAISPASSCDPGHGWLYGLVRRDVWRIGPVRIVLMRMPYGSREAANAS